MAKITGITENVRVVTMELNPQDFAAIFDLTVLATSHPSYSAAPDSVKSMAEFLKGLTEV